MNNFFIYCSSDASNAKVTIAGSECTIITITSTQIQCKTDSYSSSSVKALIQVAIKEVGLALNVKKAALIKFNLLMNFKL